MSDFYDWTKTLSFDAEVTMICGARGIGKTYGLRKQLVKDYLKRGYRFVIIVRYKDKIPKVRNDFFARLQEKDEFPTLDFKTEGRYAYISRGVTDKGAPAWEKVGYFVALTEAQDTKEMTFVNVKRIILDEFILDKDDRHRRYLYDEYTKLVTIEDSVARENTKDKTHISPRIYLLGNALNIVNPYFQAFGIKELPPRGYSWHYNKTVLLHYSDDAEYSAEKAENTLAGKLYKLSRQHSQNVDNTFVISNVEHIKKKPSHARFIFGVIYKGKRFGVWCDAINEHFYINEYIPPNREDIYALSLSDKELNYRVAKKNERRIISLHELFCEDRLFFIDEQTREAFFEIFALYGARI